MISGLDFFPSRHDLPTDTAISPETRKDEKDITSLRFNQVTWVTSHNAHANNFAAGDNVVRLMATNQRYSIYQQLKEVGVRGLMLDLQYKEEGIRLVHGVDFSWLEDSINWEIVPFLEEDRQAIITLDLETLGDRGLIMQELRSLLAQTPSFTRRIFRIQDERWANHTEWPTIKEMRDADQRIVILSDSTIVQSDDLGIMLRGETVLENHWLKGPDKCSPRNEYIEAYDLPWTTRHIQNKSWGRLFTLNHFFGATGLASRQRVKPQNIGGGDNGWGVLFPRIQHCMEENGHSLKPNYIAIDWAHIGDAHEIADYLTHGGAVGVGQPCRSGLDCATGACGSQGKCHCQICKTDCISGCLHNETCIVLGDSGMHVCANDATGYIHSIQSNEAALVSQYFMLHSLVVIWYLLFG